jgi:hypothetical protein
LLEYYKIADKYGNRKGLPNIRCTYDGRTYEIGGSKPKMCHLENYHMPFQ